MVTIKGDKQTQWKIPEFNLASYWEFRNRFSPNSPLANLALDILLEASTSKGVHPALP